MIKAALYTVFVWWFSTGVILYLNGLPKPSFKWSMSVATLVLAAALYALQMTSTITEPWAAYCAFTSAVLVWAWQEMGFLLGYVTGTRKTDCPLGARGWKRFGFAAETILYHELALVVLALLVWLMTYGGDNQVGLWTYLVLWAMRQSAKLNVYFGVRNLNEEFLPQHLKYLQTYFTRKPMNVFLPFSVMVATAVVVPIWQAVAASPAGGFSAVGLTLVAMLLALAILEHFFLVVPLPFEALWKWGLRSRVANPTSSPLI
jgi:putative photosynthetic complex assembly protein 2